MVVQVGDALNIAARFVSARVHVDLGGRLIFAFDELAVEIGDDHIIRLYRSPADRMGQDHQMIRPGNTGTNMAAVIDQSRVEQHARRHREFDFELR